MYNYPYGDTQQLNLDWFLTEFQNLVAAWEQEKAGIDGALDAEIAKAEAALADVFAARDAAATSATAANGSAQAAAQSASDASGYLATVDADATAARNAASNANRDATAANGSAQAAAQSATDAQTAATGVEESAAQITQNADDIADLKNAVDSETTDKINNQFNEWEQGSLQYRTGVNTDNDRTDRLRTKKYIVGSSIENVSIKNNYHVCIFVYSLSGVYEGILQSDGTVAIANSYYYFDGFPYAYISDDKLYRFILAEKSDANIYINDSTNIVITLKNDIIEQNTIDLSADCLSVFCSEMNRKAASLGMSSSSFDHPSGRYTTNQITAKDMVKLGVACCGNEQLNKIWGKKSYTITTKDILHRQIQIETTVQDLERLDNFYYVFGGKTGHVEETCNLLAVCEVAGKKIVGAIGQATNENARFSAMKQLMNIAEQKIGNGYCTIPFTKAATKNYILWETGLGSASFPAYFYTDFIDISDYSEIQYKNYLVTAASPKGGMAFYTDADKTTYISGVPAVAGNPSPGYGDFVTLTVPSGAKYARFSGLNDEEQYGKLEIRGIVSSVTDAENACACVLPDNPSMYEQYPFEYLYEQNDESVFNPCSVTKCLTSLVALDYCKNIHDVVNVIRKDVIAGSGDNLHELDQISVEDAIYDMMLPSSNDAAQTLARCIGFIMLNDYKLDYLLNA